MQFLDKVVEMPTVVQRQVPMVQMVQKTVSREERQSACVIATGRVAAYQSDIDSLELKLRTSAIRMRITVESGDKTTRAAAER